MSSILPGSFHVLCHSFLYFRQHLPFQSCYPFAAEKSQAVDFAGSFWGLDFAGTRRTMLRARGDHSRKYLPAESESPYSVNSSRHVTAKYYSPQCCRCRPTEAREHSHATPKLSLSDMSGVHTGHEPTLTHYLMRSAPTQSEWCLQWVASRGWPRAFSTPTVLAADSRGWALSRSTCPSNFVSETWQVAWSLWAPGCSFDCESTWRPFGHSEPPMELAPYWLERRYFAITSDSSCSISAVRASTIFSVIWRPCAAFAYSIRMRANL